MPGVSSVIAPNIVKLKEHSMKQFETVLPEMSGQEIRFLFGRLYKMIQDGGWNVLTDLKEAVETGDKLGFKAEGRTRAGVLRLTLVFLKHGELPALHAIFDEDEIVDKARGELQVGATMSVIDAGVRSLLEPLPGQKLWALISGNWLTAVQFEK